ncbi:MAG TPA: hypothetical protein DCS93_03170, partial [Microscillaceae bacterium]|nr:hypothetical protein [Microscillaceae bacterium]
RGANVGELDEYTKQYAIIFSKKLKILRKPGKQMVPTACPKPSTFRNTRLMYAFAIPLVGFLADKVKTV